MFSGFLTRSNTNEAVQKIARSLNFMIFKLEGLHYLHKNADQGSAVAWWLMPRTPDPEVEGSSPTQIKPCCVLEKGTFTPQKYW